MSSLQLWVRRNWLSYVAAPLFVLVAGLVVHGNGYQLYIATSIAISFILTVSFNILYGYAGIFNMAQVFIFGVGAFTSIYTQVHLGLNFWLAMLMAVVMSAAVSVLVAIPTWRVAGLFMAILTLGLTLAGTEVLRLWDEFSGGSNGIYAVPNPELFGTPIIGGTWQFFTICGIAAVVVFDLSLRIDRSPLGKRLVALREGPRTLGSVGVSPSIMRVIAFAIAGALAGLAGCLYAPFQATVSLDSFGLTRLVELLIATIIGGAGRRFGPVFGVIALVTMEEVALILGGAHGLILGIGVMVLIVVGRGGIAGLAEQSTRGLAARSRPRIARYRKQSVRGEFDTVPESVDSSTLSLTGVMPREAAGECLTARHVTARFGALIAVQDVSLSVNPSEVVGVIGPNGAGKTTFLNAISGDLAAEGRIFIGNKEITRLKPHEIVRAGVARTFQSPQLIPELSVLDNILLGGTVTRTSPHLSQMLDTRSTRKETARLRARALNLMRVLGIFEYADQPAKLQPYGLQKIIEIIRSLMLSPRYLLLDEPGAGLSEQERSDLVNVLIRISGLNVGAVLIDHNLDLMRTACTRLVVIENGEIIADGDVKETLTSSAVVAAYVGGRAES